MHIAMYIRAHKNTHIATHIPYTYARPLLHPCWKPIILYIGPI